MLLLQFQVQCLVASLICKSYLSLFRGKVHTHTHSLGVGDDLPGGGGKQLEMEPVDDGWHEHWVSVERLRGLIPVFLLNWHLCHPTLITRHQSMHLLYTHIHPYFHSHILPYTHTLMPPYTHTLLTHHQSMCLLSSPYKSLASPSHIDFKSLYHLLLLA